MFYPQGGLDFAPYPTYIATKEENILQRQSGQTKIKQGLFEGELLNPKYRTI
ncbi:hypothetical protein [Arachidicoccus sp.]|uniref:hypothetical protein n=1 Tax=Arachidicoccus sp. TaxID=1872624 RepID=UPI003D1976F8